MSKSYDEMTYPERWENLVKMIYPDRWEEILQKGTRPSGRQTDDPVKHGSRID